VVHLNGQIGMNISLKSQEQFLYAVIVRADRLVPSWWIGPEGLSGLAITVLLLVALAALVVSALGLPPVLLLGLAMILALAHVLPCTLRLTVCSGQTQVDSPEVLSTSQSPRVTDAPD